MLLLYPLGFFKSCLILLLNTLLLHGLELFDSPASKWILRLLNLVPVKRFLAPALSSLTLSFCIAFSQRNDHVVGVAVVKSWHKGRLVVSEVIDNDVPFLEKVLKTGTFLIEIVLVALVRGPDLLD